VTWIVFIGEAQPTARSGLICRQLIDRVVPLGVKKVFTFAAMATEMRPGQEGRVFGAAIDRETLESFKQLDVQLLQSGQISGLNGVLLGVAAESGMSGGCLLGEIPGIFAQLPYPTASLGVLEFFTTMAGIGIDLRKLAGHARDVDGKLAGFFEKIERAIHEAEAPEAAEPPEQAASGSKKPRLEAADRQHLEQLFAEAASDRARAYFFKQELDRLQVFPEYEDRFLDLFKDPGPP
jgi:proteasome assembly chaperone (PAC2) family protein